MSRRLMMAAASAAGLRRLNGIAPAASMNDPYFANVTSLLHFESGLTDQKGLTWTASGTAAATAASSKFGAQSLGVPASGNSAIRTPTSTDWNVGTGDFTVEFWFRRNGTPQVSSRLFQTRDGDVYPGIGITINDGAVDGRVQFYMSSNASSFDIASAINLTNITDTLYHFITVSRVGTSIRSFVDGGLVSTVTSSAAPYYNAADSVIIGGNATGTSRSAGVYIDDFRFTKGIGRYTAAFTPPIAQFPDA